MTVNVESVTGYFALIAYIATLLPSNSVVLFSSYIHSLLASNSTEKPKEHRFNLLFILNNSWIVNATGTQCRLDECRYVY